MIPEQPVARRWPLGLSTGQVGEVPTAGHRGTEQAGLLVKLGGPGPQAEQVPEKVLVGAVLLQATE